MLKKNENVVSSLFNSTLMVMVFSALVSLIGMLIDGIVIGNFLGVDSMASYGLASPIFVVISAIGGVFSSGLQTSCAKTLGSGDLKRAKKQFSSMCIVGVAAAILLMVLLCAFSGILAGALGAKGSSENLYDPTRQYLFGLGLGIPGMIMMNLLTPVMQLDNDRSRVMKSTVYMTVVNVIGDLLVAFVLPWGMLGMAIFTALSYYVAMVYLLFHFRAKNIIFKFSIKDMDLKDIPSMLWTGVPTAVNRLCNTMRSLCLNKLLLVIAASGAVAAFSVQSNMVSLFGSVGTGIGLATLMLSGLFYGEEDRTSLHRLINVGLQKILYIICPIAVILFVFAPVFVGLYGADSDPSVKSMAVHAVRYYAVSLPLYAINIIFMNYLQGTHNLVFANIVCILDNFAYVVISAVVLGLLTGTDGVWAAFPIGEVLTLITMFIIAFVYNHKLPYKTENYLFLNKNFDVPDAQKLECTIDSMEQVVAVSEQTRAFCKEHHLSERSTYLLSLYIEEMAGNIIRHGFEDNEKNHMDIKLVLKGNNAILRFRDDCKQFNPKQYAEMINSEDPVAHIGIRMVVKSADSIDYVNAMKLNNLIIHMNI
ncbi:MAG: MATE family efflux transporter [Candidatus Ornithomonoglobus sp.]